MAIQSDSGAANCGWRVLQLQSLRAFEYALVAQDGVGDYARIWRSIHGTVICPETLQPICILAYKIRKSCLEHGVGCELVK